MKLTKFQHACLVIQKNKTVIVVDPGGFTRDFIMPKQVDAIVITHEHGDHFDEKLIKSILENNPKATVIAHESIAGRFGGETQTIPATVGQPYAIGDISLQFFGGQHATIVPALQPPANLGVLFDESLYYPGDSFVIPEGHQVTSLAIPVSAPWLKISEVIEFLSQIKPVFAFPTHDAILSADGKAIVDTWLSGAAGQQNTQYKRLDESSVELP